MDRLSIEVLKKIENAQDTIQEKKFLMCSESLPQNICLSSKTKAILNLGGSQLVLIPTCNPFGGLMESLVLPAKDLPFWKRSQARTLTDG